MIQEEKYKLIYVENINGKQLRKARLSKNLDIYDIYSGICSRTTYINIEQGRRIPQKIVMDTLCQRVGITQGYMGKVVSKKEYIIFNTVKKIIGAIIEGDVREIDKMLTEYYCICEKLNKLYTQNYLVLSAIKSLYIDRLYDEALIKLNNAILITRPQFEDENVFELRFSYIEICIYFLRLKVRNELGERINYEKEREVLRYIKNQVDNRFSIYILPLFLELLNDVIHMKIAGTKNDFDVIRKILYWQSYEISKICPINKLILNKRQALGITQEMLSTGICTAQTISRIERGISYPKKRVKHAIFQVLGIDGDIEKNK